MIELRPDVTFVDIDLGGRDGTVQVVIRLRADEALGDEQHGGAFTVSGRAPAGPLRSRG